MTEPQAHEPIPLDWRAKFWIGVGIAVIVVSVLLMIVG